MDTMTATTVCTCHEGVLFIHGEWSNVGLVECVIPSYQTQVPDIQRPVLISVLNKVKHEDGNRALIWIYLLLSVMEVVDTFWLRQRHGITKHLQGLNDNPEM